MKTSLLNLCLVVLVLSGCSKNDKWQGIEEVRNGVAYIHNPEEGLWKDSNELVLRKILTIGEIEGDENYILSKPYDVKVNKAGNIYICDFSDDGIKIYDRDGNYIKKIGHRGQGPGELLGPKFFDLDSQDNIYVYESGNMRISIFLSDGKFHNSFSFRQQFEGPSSLKVTPDGQILLAAHNMLPPLKHLIYQYDRDGNLIEAYAQPTILGKSSFGEQYAKPRISLLPDHSVLCALEYPYEIRNYTLKGNLTKVVTRQSTLFTAPQPLAMPSDNFYLRSRALINRIITFPNGDFIVRIIDQGDDYVEKYKSAAEMKGLPSGYRLDLNLKYLYDLYDSKGRFLQTFSLDKDAGRIVYIDFEGYIYTVNHSDQIPRVGKYLISFENKKD